MLNICVLWAAPVYDAAGVEEMQPTSHRQRHLPAPVVPVKETCACLLISPQRIQQSTALQRERRTGKADPWHAAQGRLPSKA